MTIASVERVPRNTEEEVNRRMRPIRSTSARRLCELDAEWDIERAIEANASTLALVPPHAAFDFGLDAFTPISG